MTDLVKLIETVIKVANTTPPTNISTRNKLLEVAELLDQLRDPELPIPEPKKFPFVAPTEVLDTAKCWPDDFEPGTSEPSAN